VPPDGRSIVKPVIKRNRKETIVFDLNRCLHIQYGGIAEREKTGILMLNDKVGDSSLGLLLAGCPAIVTLEPPLKLTRPDPRLPPENPIHGIIRKAGSGNRKKARNEMIWIDVRRLIGNCIVKLSVSGYPGLSAGVA
jgi:hypothetical protein